MACGKANPKGFQLDLYIEGRRVTTDFRLPEHVVGFPGVAHGGVLCTLFDEVMAWAAIEATGRFCVTGEMNVRFLAPAVPGEVVTAWGEPAEDKRRYLVCTGEVRNAAGKTLAKAEGKFFPVSPARQREMEERWRREAAAFETPTPAGFGTRAFGDGARPDHPHAREGAEP
jgi:uncharacterized protein (TIGR00369 family)